MKGATRQTGNVNQANSNHVNLNQIIYPYHNLDFSQFIPQFKGGWF